MGKLKIGVFGAQRGMTMIHQLLGNPYACVTAICDKTDLRWTWRGKLRKMPA